MTRAKLGNRVIFSVNRVISYFLTLKGIVLNSLRLAIIYRKVYEKCTLSCIAYFRGKL